MSEQLPAQASLSEASPRPLMPGPPSQSLREKLLSLRAKSRASLQTTRRTNTKEDEPAHVQRASSISPQVQETPVVVKQHRPEPPQSRLPVVSPLPLRSLQPISHAPTYPSKLGLHSENSYSPSTIALSPAHLGEMEFVIPLSMNTRVKDQYISTIHYYQQAIKALLKDEVPNDQIREQVRKMVERANQVTTHIDLDSPSQVAQEQQYAHEEALWAENCSSKFKFIRHLFDAVKQFDVHIAIVGRSGRLLDILETFLRGRRLRYSRPDTLSRSNAPLAKGRVNVTLLASGPDGAAYLPRPATLVIAFDGSFNAQDPQVKLLRNHLVNVGQISPVIHLLVYGSAEHIERCLPESTDSLKRLRKMVNYITQTRDDVGRLLPDELGAAASAEEVAAFLEAGAMEKDWAVPSIRSIEVEGLEMDEATPSREHGSDPENNSMASTSPMARQSSNSKRSLDADVNMNDSATIKRQKTIATSEESRSRNSVAETSQTVGHLIDKSPFTAMPVRRSAAPTPFSSHPFLSLPVPLSSLMRQLQQDIAEELMRTRERLKAAEIFQISLQNGIKAKEQKVENELAAEIARHQETKRMREEYNESLQELQLRFEMKNKKVRTLSAACDQNEADLAAAISRSARQSAELATMFEEKAILEAALKESRDALLNSSGLSVAEREGFQEQIRTFKETNASLNKKVANINHDLEYCREQYQTASNAAVEATTRVSELEGELAIAQRKASGEAVKLATLNQSTENSALRNEIEHLGLEIKAREDLLRRKEEELRDLKRGRTGVVTRGNSVGGKSSRGASPGVGAAAGGVGVGGGFLGGGGGGGGGGAGKGGLGGSSLRFQ